MLNRAGPGPSHAGRVLPVQGPGATMTGSCPNHVGPARALAGGPFEGMTQRLPAWVDLPHASNIAGKGGGGTIGASTGKPYAACQLSL